MEEDHESIKEDRHSKECLNKQNKNRHNITDITDITGQQDRSQGSIWCSRGILEAYRKYSKRVYGKSMADCLERALLNDMKNNPVKEVNIEIKHLEPDHLSDVQQRLEIAIMYSEIERLVDILDRIDRTGIGKYNEFKNDLIRALKPAVKLQNPPERFLELLKRAENHVEF